MIRIEVDRSRCDNHGHCVLIASGIFSFDQNGHMMSTGIVDVGQLDIAEDAADSCPTQAIRVCPDA